MSVHINPENVYGLILGDAFALGFPILEMFMKISFNCLDLSGLRLHWLTREEFNTITLSSSFPAAAAFGDELIPCLSICLRGHNALEIWQKIVGPRNCKIARYTDQ